MIRPTPPRLPDASPDDPWQRAHEFPDFAPKWRWLDYAALALIVAAILAAAFLAGRLSANAAEAQAASCMEGCP